MKEPPLPLEEAQARLLALVSPLPVEDLPSAQAAGRYLAADVAARRTQPPADQSAMDGYAVATADLAGPWQLIGESAAGHPFSGTIRPGEAARISTGAWLPAGAGAVVLQEDVNRSGDRVSLTGTAPSPGHKHIRPKGMDFVMGDVLMSAGTRLGPAQIALALAGGHGQLPVRRRARVAIIDSGDELSANLSESRPDQIPASNGVMLAAMAEALPCDSQYLGPVGDDMDAIVAVLDRAGDADLIVTSGGASVGDHDLIRPALEAWGAEIAFWRIAIKPGKPLLVARRGQQLVLGLPGNPVSSHVTAFLFMLPLLRCLSGAAAPLPMPVTTRLAAPLRAGGERREFLRGLWDGNCVTPAANQDSGALTGLAASNVLIERGAQAPEAAAGSEVRIYLLEHS